MNRFAPLGVGIVCIGLLFGAACAQGTGGSTGTGGTADTGGSTGTGGASHTGGTNGTGGTTGTGGAATGGSIGTGGGSATGGITGTGGGTATGGTTGTGGMAGKAGSTGGTTGTGGSATGGTAGTHAGTGGAAGSTGGAGGTTTVDCSSSSGVITFPTLPGATVSPLYTVTANGASQFVEKLTKFSPEMQVHYAYFGVASGCTATIAVTVSGGFTSYTLSPKSKNLTATKSGSTLTFTSGPNYLILQFDTKELLFILIDDQETNPPKLGDANVKNLADSTVDNTGGTLVTSKFQTAINAASGATQNILYVPPGRYKVGELSMKSNMTLYLAAGAILDGSTSTGDYAAAGPAVESTTHGLIHFNNVMNSNLLGRGVIDGEGTRSTTGATTPPPSKSTS